MTIKDIISLHEAGLSDEQILTVAQTLETAVPEKTAEAEQPEKTAEAEQPERAEAEAEQPEEDFREYFRKLDKKISAMESRVQADALSSARQPANAFKPTITADDAVKKIINGGR